MAITPSSKDYTLINSGSGPINWSVTTNQTWIDINPTSGSLNPGESVVVTIAFNDEAADLPSQEEPYVAVLTFANGTNGCGNKILEVILNTSQPQIGWPPLSIETGEGGASYIANGDSFDGSSLFSFPDFFFRLRNEDNPPFVSDGNLSISNLIVTCAAHPSYFGTITSAGPVGAGSSCTFQVESGGGDPPGGSEVIVSVDWVCGTQSGTYEITITT